jgi:23S rRNA pseudouridine1911/1915/1917 synthase
MTSRTFHVPDEYQGDRLDRFLAAVLSGYSRSQVQRLIKEGHVRVGARDGKSNQAVKTGEEVVVDVPELMEPAPQAEALPLPILYQDADLIVVDKPAGMVVHPAAGHASGTLVNALLHHVEDLSGIGGEKRPGIVHRLDRGTSGLMVVAKHDAAHEELARQFHDREVEKEYLALVWGCSRRAGASMRRSDAIPRTARRCRRAPGAVERPSRASCGPST